MNIDEFWNLVERVHAAAGGDMKAKCALLAEELRGLPKTEALSFGSHFADCWHQAYSWDVWGAAFVIRGGCSDDSFMDFRATLISLGRAAFETAMTQPDSLVNFNINREWAAFEGYQSVVDEACAEKPGGRRYRGNRRKRPKEPAGVRWKEWELSRQFPKLAARYGHQDSQWLWRKKEKDAKNMAERVVTIMLESGLIPHCGLIPPLRVAASVLRTGASPKTTGRQYTWEPFELEERHYWLAASRLEKISAKELKARPDLRGVSLRLDTGASGASDFSDWAQMLAERGLK